VLWVIAIGSLLIPVLLPLARGRRAAVAEAEEDAEDAEVDTTAGR
jgi:hypothetical protein